MLSKLASGAVQIVEFHMADLMRQITVQRGLDPRDCTVYAYGGGGPGKRGFVLARLGCRAVRRSARVCRFYMVSVGSAVC